MVLLDFFEGIFEAICPAHDRSSLRLQPRVILDKFRDIRHRGKVVTLGIHLKAKCMGRSYSPLKILSLVRLC
jgi:hypothetical protein